MWKVHHPQWLVCARRRVPIDRGSVCIVLSLISVNNKSDFSGRFDNSKMMRFLGRLSGWKVDPVVALHLRNAAGYRLPTFGPTGTKLGPSRYQCIIKSDFSGWFDNSEKGEVCLGRLSGWGGVIPWLHSTSRMLQTTAYLLLDHMAPN